MSELSLGTSISDKI